MKARNLIWLGLLPLLANAETHVQASPPPPPTEIVGTVIDTRENGDLLIMSDPEPKIISKQGIDSALAKPHPLRSRDVVLLRNDPAYGSRTQGGHVDVIAYADGVFQEDGTTYRAYSCTLPKP